MASIVNVALDTLELKRSARITPEMSPRELLPHTSVQFGFETQISEDLQKGGISRSNSTKGVADNF